MRRYATTGSILGSSIYLYIAKVTTMCVCMCVCGCGCVLVFFFPFNCRSPKGSSASTRRMSNLHVSLESRRESKGWGVGHECGLLCCSDLSILCFLWVKPQNGGNGGSSDAGDDFISFSCFVSTLPGFLNLFYGSVTFLLSC